jgi:multiple sugar transport system substrate-binding protein
MSDDLNRRKFLEGTAGAAPAGLGTGTALFAPPRTRRRWNLKPEKARRCACCAGAASCRATSTPTWRTSRSSREDRHPVRVDNEGWEDVRPKAAVAANTGAGPGHHPVDQRRREPLSRQAARRHRRRRVPRARSTAAGTPAGEAFLQPDGKKWIGLPLGAAGAMMVYRESMVKAAGFDEFPKDTDSFLKMMKALKEKGTPGGWRSATPPATASGATG